MSESSAPSTALLACRLLPDSGVLGSLAASRAPEDDEPLRFRAMDSGSRRPLPSDMGAAKESVSEKGEKRGQENGRRVSIVLLF